MLKILIGLVIGLFGGATIVTLRAASRENDLESKHQNALDDMFSKAFHTGWDSATTEFKTYHKIYHKDCQSIFCPK